MKMIIFQRSRMTHIELHGLVDKQDAHILYQECGRLVEEGHQRLVFNLAKVSRISDQAIHTFVHIYHLFKLMNGLCIFVAPQSRLYAALSEHQLPVQSIDVNDASLKGQNLQLSYKGD